MSQRPAKGEQRTASSEERRADSEGRVAGIIGGIEVGGHVTSLTIATMSLGAAS